MVRVGGMRYTIAPTAEAGKRIRGMELADGRAIDPEKIYTVAGWASVNEGVEGPPVWDVLARHLEQRKVVEMPESSAVKVVDA